MRRAIVVPDVGANSTAEISAWYVHVGERVYAGDRVVELLLGAATFDVPAPCDGTLIETLARLGDRVTKGQTVSYIEEDPEA
jgi:pyruvate/2-oxoglutarate dehydrogenase complex dihydrolipoamide acyltransferase (E2) component